MDVLKAEMERKRKMLQDKDILVSIHLLLKILCTSVFKKLNNLLQI